MVAESGLKQTEKKIIGFIQKFARDKAVVIGLSGGIDSAVVATLCVKALGNDKVHGLLMPEKGVSLIEDVKDAEELVMNLEVDYKIWPINNALFELLKLVGTRNKSTIGNVKARIRMILLYAYANENMLLVAGTGNKSELMTGYFTKYGDGGVDFLPIGDLCKSEVRELAELLGVSRKIIDKKPSAGLWRGQTDEDEMGISYTELDKTLMGRKVNHETKEKVYNMVKNSKHKRDIAKVCKI